MLDQQNCLLRQYQETLTIHRDEEYFANVTAPSSDEPSYLTIPRPRVVKREGEKADIRRLEMENLRQFKKRMDKKMHQKNMLFNICDL